MRRRQLIPRAIAHYEASPGCRRWTWRPWSGKSARVYAPPLARRGRRAPRGDEGALQRLMDEYAGGVSQFYRTNEERLDYALKHNARLQSQFG